MFPARQMGQGRRDEAAAMAIAIIESERENVSALLNHAQRSVRPQSTRAHVQSARRLITFLKQSVAVRVRGPTKASLPAYSSK